MPAYPLLLPALSWHSTPYHQRLSLPPAEAEFGALPAVEGVPVVGSVVAYRLLEMGPTFTPQVGAAAVEGLVLACLSCSAAAKEGSPPL